MILLAMGLPGRFAEWCDALLVRLAARLGPQVACHAWPSLAEMLTYNAVSQGLGELARILITNDAEHLVIAARQPNERLCQALAESGTPILLALDDPRMVAFDLLARKVAGPKQIVRAVANSCAAIMQLEELPHALTIRAKEVGADLAAAIAAVAAHFGIAIDSGGIAAILEELGALALWPVPEDGAAPAAALPEPIARMVDGALLGYHGHFGRGRLDRIIWTRDLFILADEREKSPTELIDIAGERRFLTFGPYIQLPAGSWSAQVALGFSAEAATAHFSVDVFDLSGGELARSAFQPGAPGIHNAELTFALGAPHGAGVEIRVILEAAHPAGRMGFGRVVLQPLTVRRKDAAEEAEDFARVLEL